ncbi:MAG: type I DNA topoisomerase [Patescibacteria group bacterium]
MKLLIVESPTKAKTISRFLGKDYKVRSSYGHVMDLPKNKLGIDVENNFQPEYTVTPQAKKNLRELKKFSPKAEEIILATDEDREGEAISWHLTKALKITPSKTKRIVFHEITPEAIKKALQNPREIDMNLVDAQQARRTLDRLVGYNLSPLLWKKIRKGLSAGRVQSVAVRLLVEREREREKFQSQEYWELSAELQKDQTPFIAKLWKKNQKAYKKTDISNKNQAEEIKKAIENSQLAVENISKKELTKNPPPPFTTSTLQQAANSAFGFSTKRTMTVAQQLYEGIALSGKNPTGLITYMRTDSLNISRQAQNQARQVIQKLFGEKYLPDKPSFYKNKSKGAQEAHEAIRPTLLDKNPDSIKDFLSSDQYKLYKLIWERTLASQTASAKIDSTTAVIKASQKNSRDIYRLKATGSIVRFEGYMKFFSGRKKDQDNFLPELKEGDMPKLKKIIAEQKFTQPPARYSEASLVKALEEKGIGRPSTYAPTISTIQTRGYAEKDENKNLFPTEIGTLVNDLLVKHFPKIVDYQFTAEMETILDQIAAGKKEWAAPIKQFYNPFKKNIEMKNEEIKKGDFQKKLDRKCPQCGGELVEKFGKFGKFIACSGYPECRYTEKSEEEKKVEKDVLKQEGNEKGEIICEKCGGKMEVRKGPYGPFLGCTNYPQCRNIKKVENKIGVKCPNCGKDLVEKKSKKGKTFYGCSGYPKCKTMFWNKPTGEKCPKCKNLLLEKPKKIVCSNKECSYESPK